MAEEQKKKRPVTHRRAIEMLKEDPLLYLPTFLELYASGTVVPEEDIPELIFSFRKAMNEVETTLREVVGALEEQRAEAEEKGKEEATTS